MSSSNTDDGYSGWQKPIGLTKEHAIEVDDDSDDSGDGSPGPKSIASSYFNNGFSTTGSAAPEAEEQAPPDCGSQSSHSKANESSPEDEEVSGNSDCGSQSSNSKANESSPEDEEEDSGNGAQACEDLAPVDPPPPRPPVQQQSVESKAEDVETNPFASFAFSSGESLSKPLVSSWRDRKRPAAASSCAQQKSSDRQRPKKAMRNATAKTCPLLKGTKEEQREQRKILIAKWHSFASPNVPTEERRFQVLLAARIHARVQEPIVYRAMDRLRRHFNEKGEKLTCTTLARCEVEEIAPLLSSVLFGNTKAKHIIQASKDLMRFGGKVPETMIGLQSITGIGPQLSEILYTVNRRSSYDGVIQNDN